MKKRNAGPTKGEQMREKIVALVRHCERNGRSFPPRRNVCIALGIGESTLVNCIEHLRDEGAIECLGRSNYRVLAA